MDENINYLVNELFQSHQKPIVKLNTGGVKIYLPKEDNKELINKNLEILKETLRFPRVEKRNVRSQGKFLEVERRISIMKLHNLQHFGYRDKTGMYLHLEEALYLLETNRLEILWNNVPMTVQQGYNLFIDDNLTLNKYRTYKRLISDGFKVQVFKNTDKEQPPLKKTKLDASEVSLGESRTKEIKGIESQEELNSLPNTSNINGNKNSKRKDLSKTREKIINFFKSLKERAPKELNTSLENEPIYTCNSFKKADKSTKHNIHLVQQEMDPRIGYYGESSSNLFAIISNDDIPFYKISSISLPNLL